MAQSRLKSSDTEPLSFFSVPYQDESYYSILCRYMVHSGLPSSHKTLTTLFGKKICPGSTLLLPYMSHVISQRLNPETGITEDTLICRHTAFHYFRISYRAKEAAVILDRVKNGMKCGYRMSYRNSMASSYLRYCPVCAYEEKNEYGEMYWHRSHQLKGIMYCSKHGVKLKESAIDLKSIKTAFIPASFALMDIYRKTLDEVCNETEHCPEDRIKKYRTIQKDIEWIMGTSEKVPDLEATILLYKKVLSQNREVKYDNGRINDIPGLKRMLKDTLGSDFLESLHLNLHEYFEWESAPIVIAKYLTPLQHVLLMEFLCGSVEAFFTMKMDGIRYNCPGI